MKNWTLLLVLALLLGNIGLTLWSSSSDTEVAYVRSQDLVYGYFGMKEAINEFETKKTLWQGNIDTLSFDFKRSVDKLRSEADKLNEEQLAQRQNILQKQQDDLYTYRDAITAKMKEEEDKMLEGVLNQVNSFVESYAKDHNIDVVLGTTSSGSLLYGEGSMDITEDILTALNKAHAGS